MMTIIEALEAEHATFSAVFDQVERLLPTLENVAEVKLLGRLVEGLLRGHAAAEVDLGYAALDHVLEHRGQLDHLYRDHEELDARWERVRVAGDLREARRLLETALSASRKHFDGEERTVFRLIERVLPEAALAELGTAWMQQRRPLAGQVARKFAGGPVSPSPVHLTPDDPGR